MPVPKDSHATVRSADLQTFPHPALTHYLDTSSQFHSLFSCPKFLLKKNNTKTENIMLTCQNQVGGIRALIFLCK